MTKLLGRGIGYLRGNSYLLLVGTALALAWANLGNYETYKHVAHALHYPVMILMSFFFAEATKELREALLPGGSLNNWRAAATPTMATIGGVVAPAGAYLIGARLLGRPDLYAGWPVPTATDIAFVVLIMRFIYPKRRNAEGRLVDAAATVFVMAVAICDDGIGLGIIASLNGFDARTLVTIAGVAAAVGYNLVLRRNHVESHWAYLLPAGPISLAAFQYGGFEPVLCLVPLVFTMPHEKEDLGMYAEINRSDEEFKDTLNHFEHFWAPVVSLNLFFFGFTNAGVQFSSMGAATNLVAVSLILFKLAGILGFTYLGVKVFGLRLPEGMEWKDVSVSGQAAGIGFTVSLFMCTVVKIAPAVAAEAKMGALASFLAAGFAVAIAWVTKAGKYANKEQAPRGRSALA